MNWQEEVARAVVAVMPEYDEIERAFFEDVPIKAVEGGPIEEHHYVYGTYFVRDRHIEIYSRGFDEAVPAHDRERELRDTIRHEIGHALGEIHGSEGYLPLSRKTLQWLDGDELTLVRNGLRITLPGPVS